MNVYYPTEDYYHMIVKCLVHDYYISSTTKHNIAELIRSVDNSYATADMCKPLTSNQTGALLTLKQRRVILRFFDTYATRILVRLNEGKIDRDDFLRNNRTLTSKFRRFIDTTLSNEVSDTWVHEDSIYLKCKPNICPDAVTEKIRVHFTTSPDEVVQVIPYTPTTTDNLSMHTVHTWAELVQFNDYTLSVHGTYFTSTLLESKNKFLLNSLHQFHAQYKILVTNVQCFIGEGDHAWYDVFPDNSPVREKSHLEMYCSWEIIYFLLPFLLTTARNEGVYFFARGTVFPGIWISTYPNTTHTLSEQYDPDTDNWCPQKILQCSYAPLGCTEFEGSVIHRPNISQLLKEKVYCVISAKECTDISIIHYMKKQLDRMTNASV